MINEIRQQLREVNIVSFSGGKDSSVVLQGAITAIAGTGKALHIVTSDTLMEIPYFQEYVEHTKGRIQAYIDQVGINAKLVTVHPELSGSFWVSVLGMGYPAAHMGFRWCTGKLKIDPIKNYIKQVTAGQEYTVFVGVRSSESALRARIYKAKNYKPNHYAPILDWTAHDVWEYLMTEPCPWGDHTDLINVYKYSSDECVYGEKAGVCVGNARYGCWACPLQKSTQLELIGFHTQDAERYHALKEFKEILVNTANTKAYRSRIRRNGTVGCGPFLVEIRKKLYAKLKQVEQLTGWDLITPAEESLIKNHWQIDREIHNIPDNTQPMLFGVAQCHDMT
jgi:DNA sulfur modification protein DndC